MTLNLGDFVIEVPDTAVGHVSDLAKLLVVDIDTLVFLCDVDRASGEGRGMLRLTDLGILDRSQNVSRFLLWWTLYLI